MKLQNLHTHTVFGDGKNTPEEMVQGAIRAGCSSLGFSEHSELLPPHHPEGWAMTADAVPAYRKEIQRLKEAYQGTLEIFLGLELDFDTPPLTSPYDYLIGSTHLVWKDGLYLSVDESPAAFAQSVREHFGGDSLAFVEAYYQREARVAEKTGCQIAGHFDLVTKFNEGGRFFDETHPRYIHASIEALDSLLQQDVIFEINTGAISRGYRTSPYPSPFLLKALCERGGRICVTSDSHSAETITFAFPQAVELARSCGFREVWVLTQNGFQAASLSEFSEG